MYECVCVCDNNTSTCVVHMCVVSPTCTPSVTLPNYLTCFCVITASDACSANILDLPCVCGCGCVGVGVCVCVCGCGCPVLLCVL